MNSLRSLTEILSIKTNRIPIIRGIYFLINDTDNIVYIGKSTDCYRRLKTHQSQNKKYFRYYSVIPLEDGQDLDQLEIDYINKYNPYYNKANNSDALKLKFATTKNVNKSKFKGRPHGISQRLKDLSKEIARDYFNNENTISDVCSKHSIARNSLYNVLNYLGIDYKKKHKNLGNSNAGKNRQNKHSLRNTF